MRRKDREVTDIAKIKEIMRNCNACRVGFADGDKVYIVPLSFGFTENDGKFVLYFHGNKVGRKMDLAEKLEYAGFEMDTSYEMVSADLPCNFTAMFQSVIGTGKVSTITEPSAKREALTIIMKQYSPRDDFEFLDKMVDATGIFKIEVEELSCKEHLS